MATETKSAALLPSGLSPGTIGCRESLTQVLPVAVVAFDIAGHITVWNPAAESLFECAAGEVLGNNFPRCLAIAPETFLSLLQKVLGGEPALGVDVQYRTTTNRIGSARLWATPMRGPGGEIEGAVATFIDVGGKSPERESVANADLEIDQVNGELIRSEARMRAVFESGFDAIFVLDDSRTYVDVNRAACELLGVERRDVIGKKLGSFTITEDENEARAAFKGGVIKGESTLRRPGDGEKRQVEYLARTNVLPDRHLLVVRDVTERKRLEQQVQQSQKMEAVGRLAGGVAHDFNNMLTVIRGYGELLLKRVGETEPLRRYVLGIIGAADRSASITQQLLAFSRRQVMQPRVLNIKDIIPEMIHLLRRLIGEGVELRTEMPEDIGLIKADPAQLGQILLNLAVNARDAMQGSGKLLIETMNAELDATYCNMHVTTVPGSYVVISVTDNGCGMDPELRSHIFEPFFTTKEQGKGTGLGLATVYGIVKQSGGYIWVYSEKGQGTTFKIYFPRVDAVTNKAGWGDREQHGRGKTILVIEDEDSARALVSDFLREKGFRVIEANGGDEALSSCEKDSQEIDLVLADVIMPGTTGEDLAGYMAARHPRAKVLYMSGFPRQELEARGIVIRPTNLIEKPFRLVDLHKTIVTLLDQASANRKLD